MDYPYSEHANNVIQHYGLKRKTANEHGDKPCPNCGGIDRFFINEHDGLLKHHYRQLCDDLERLKACLLYTSPSPRDATLSRMPSSA